MTDYQQLLDLDGTKRFERLGAILEAVGRLGSLNQATAALHISYRQAWGLLKQAEERLGAPLLTRRVGGAEGGGAALTDVAQDLLLRYHALRQGVEAILCAPAGPAPDPARPVLLASTIGPVETGLMDTLEAAFHRESGIWVRHIAAGTGQAMEIARSGRVDLMLTHAPDLEEAFLQEGYGAARHPLMVNAFLLVGPAADPAGVAGAATAAEGMARIAAARARFLSRGDRSGTHIKEEALWAAAGVTPAAPWYQVFERGAQGSGITLAEADRQGAYTLVDQATFAKVAPAGLRPLLQGDPALRNLFSLITLRPERFPAANHAGAAAFVRWATGPEGQAVIAASGHFRPVA